MDDGEWKEGGRKKDLRNREDDEEVEPEAFEGPDVVGGNGTCVPHEFTATDDERLPRHVCQPKL